MDRKEEHRTARIIEILRNVAAGRKNALKDFYTLYGKFIFTTAMTFCRDRDNSHYIVNEVLIKVWRMADYLTSVDNLDGWLFTVTANAAKDLARGNDVAEPDKSLIAPDPYELTESNDVFYSLVTRLPPFQKEICVCKFVSDMTFADIAAVTGRPVSTVSTAYYQALKTLKKIIIKRGDRP